MTPSRLRRIMSDRPEALLLERRDSTDHAGAAAKRTGDDAARIDGGAKRTALDLRAQWLEQRLAGLRHAASDHDDIGIQDVEQIPDAGAEEAGGVAHDL